MIVVNDTIYIAGDGDEGLFISAISLEGKLRWQTKNGAVWTRPYPGARAACCYDNGKLYHMNAHGRLACLDAGNGSELWALNVLDRFEAENITWGISESVLVDGDLVFVTPAGTKALMAALNKKTGETVWAAEPLADEQASYASPVLLNVGEKRLLVNSGSHHAFAVDATGGEVLWRIRHLDPDRTITTTPILSGLMVATKDGLSAPREAPDAELAHCELADTAGAWWPAEAKIDSEAVVVTSASVQTPVAVRYAYEVSPENCNLYNWGGETSIFCSCLATDRAVFSTLRRVSTASSALSQSPRCSLPSPRQSESFHNSDRETSRGAAFRRSVATARGDRSPRSILPLLP